MGAVLIDGEKRSVFGDTLRLSLSGDEASRYGDEKKADDGAEIPRRGVIRGWCRWVSTQRPALRVCCVV